MTEANQTAFPRPMAHDVHTGLTKREYFAAMALPGLLADTVRRLSLEEAVKASVYVSDELIKALNND